MPHKQPPKEHQFTSENQPSKEQVKKRAETRKMRLKLKPFISKYVNLSFDEFTAIQEKLKTNPKEFTMLDIIAINAITKMSKDFRYYQDHRDRSEGKAIQKQEIQADVTGDMKTEVTGEIKHNHETEISDDRAAQILSILLGAGAVKPESEETGKAETDQVDSVDSNS
jgi:hypothetical protein